MSKQYRLLSIFCGFILVALLALWPGHWSSRAAASVTLIRFTAGTLPGQPEVYLDWETGTELDTAGFFITRSDIITGSFSRVSGFIPHEGDSVSGAEYSWPDDSTVLNHTYWYKLEEITTDQQSAFYGPVTVTAGTLITSPDTATPSSTPTATPTRTPTWTPSPTSTATPTARQNTKAATSTTSPSSVVVTPRVATGATITPQPTLSSNSSSPAAEAAAPTSALPLAVAQPPTSVATAVPLALDAATVAAVAPPDAVARPAQQQAPAPTLASTDAAPAVAEPIVVATEAAPMTATTDSTSTAAPLLIAAAFLFLGLAFVILRQARQ